MNLYINPIEGLWIGVNLVAIAVTLVALRLAYRDREMVSAMNGRAREVALTQAVTREVARLMMLGCLLVSVIPSLFVDGNTPLNVTTVALMLVPVILLSLVVVEYVLRRRVLTLVTSEMAEARALAADRAVNRETLERLKEIQAVPASVQQTTAMATDTNLRVRDIQGQVSDATVGAAVIERERPTAREVGEDTNTRVRGMEHRLDPEHRDAQVLGSPPKPPAGGSS